MNKSQKRQTINDNNDDSDAFKIIKPKFLKKSKREKLAKQKELQAKEEELKRKQELEEAIKQKKAKKLAQLQNEQDEDDTHGYRNADEYNANGTNGSQYRSVSEFNKRSSSNNRDKDSNKKASKSGKLKFSFEWSTEEDTSLDYQPLITVNGTGNGSGSNNNNNNNNNGSLVPKSLADRLNWDDKHWSAKKLSEMTSRDWRILKEDFEINSKGAIHENPLRSWQESAIPDEILTILQKLRYNEPTPIQRAAIPVALKNKDVLGIAETGSGKTLSFVIPLLSYLFKLPKLTNATKNDGPYSLILVPTRELAQQIHTEVSKFTRFLKFRVAAIYGGHQLETNAFDLQDGIEILIATPGRLLDCLDRKILVLNQCFYLIMDEADRMIDLGFEKQVNQILSILPNLKKQGNSSASLYNRFAKALGIRRNTTMMFTATMPPAIEKLTKNYLTNPSTVVIGNPEKAADTVDQKVEFTNSDEIKNKKLLALLSHQRQYTPPIIIFVNYKKTCDMLHELISTNTRYKPVIIHGSKSQDQREYAIKNLRNGNFQVLIATDLAGRGIDIPNVSLVVNYQMSKHIEDYIHRIGRTGRAGNLGTAVTFLNAENDKDVMYDLKMMIIKSELSKCPDELRRHPYAIAKLNQYRAIND